MEYGNRIVLIDIGTGSGCIPISIKKIIQQKNKKIHLTAYATDISRRALNVAKKNADKHGVIIVPLQGNLLTPVLKKIQNSIFHIPYSIIITANLPYLTQTQYEEEPSIQHEPRSALVADNAGLALYEELLQQLEHHQALLIPCSLFLEIDPSQTSRLLSLIKKYFPFAQTTEHQDLAGRDRVIGIRLGKML